MPVGYGRLLISRTITVSPTVSLNVGPGIAPLYVSAFRLVVPETIGRREVVRVV
jgi:hypothetical protein